MGIGEPPPLFRQPVDVRRLHLRRAITSQVAIAQVIGKYEYDIGALSSGEWQGQPTTDGEDKSSETRQEFRQFTRPKVLATFATTECQEFHFSFFRRVLICFRIRVSSLPLVGNRFGRGGGNHAPILFVTNDGSTGHDGSGAPLSTAAMPIFAQLSAHGFCQLLTSRARSRNWQKPHPKFLSDHFAGYRGPGTLMPTNALFLSQNGSCFSSRGKCSFQSLIRTAWRFSQL